MKTQQSESLGCSKSVSKREVYSNTSLPQEARKISNKKPNLTPKGARKSTTNKTQVQEMIKIKAETNDIETEKKQ